MSFKNASHERVFDEGVRRANARDRHQGDCVYNSQISPTMIKSCDWHEAETVMFTQEPGWARDEEWSHYSLIRSRSYIAPAGTQASWCVDPRQHDYREIPWTGEDLLGSWRNAVSMTDYEWPTCPDAFSCQVSTTYFTITLIGNLIVHIYLLENVQSVKYISRALRSIDTMSSKMPHMYGYLMKESSGLMLGTDIKGTMSTICGRSNLHDGAMALVAFACRNPEEAGQEKSHRACKMVNMSSLTINTLWQLESLNSMSCQMRPDRRPQICDLVLHEACSVFILDVAFQLFYDNLMQVFRAFRSVFTTDFRASETCLCFAGGFHEISSYIMTLRNKCRAQW